MIHISVTLMQMEDSDADSEANTDAVSNDLITKAESNKLTGIVRQKRVKIR